MYKIYIENRFITISSQPDRLQNYCLFHKYHDQKALSDQIVSFLNNPDTGCINIYSYNIDTLWNQFVEIFHFLEASGGIVLDGIGRLLLIRRYNNWDAPKGHFEPGETPEECAIREIREETGVDCGDLISKLSPSFHIYKFEGEFYLKKTHWHLYRLKGPGNTVPQLEEGITEASWISREQLAEIRDGMWSSIQDVINQVLHKHKNHL